MSARTVKELAQALSAQSERLAALERECAALAARCRELEAQSKEPRAQARVRVADPDWVVKNRERLAAAKARAMETGTSVLA